LKSAGKAEKPGTSEQRQSLFEKRQTWFAAAALGLLTFLAFSNSFSTGFVLDSQSLLLQDPRIREFTSENIRLILQHTYWWPHGEAGLYRPFTTLSYLFNYAVLGNANDPTGYHSINFLLHLGNVFLVWALLRRLLREFWPSFFAAALWAVHPALTESVTNLAGRPDLLSAMAVLSGFLMYLKSSESAGWRRLSWLAGLMAVTTLGVFSKESGVVIVAVIALYEVTWWKGRKQAQALLWGSLATLLPIAAMLYQRSKVLAASPPADFPFVDNPIVGANLWIGRLTAIKVIPRYLALTVWPATLSCDYSYAQIPLVHGGIGDWLACLTVLAAAVLVIGLFWWNRTAFFFASFATITFLPMSNLLLPIGTIMAERFLYVPMIGLLACLVIAIYAGGRRLHRERFVPVLLCLIAAAFLVRTWVRNADWQDERTMAEVSVRTSPNSFKVHRLLSSILYADGAEGSDLSGAIREAEKAIAILDPLPDSRNDLKIYRKAGGLYLIKGDLLHEHNSSEGAHEYQRALELLKRAVAIDESTREEYDRKGMAEWARRHSTVAAASKSDPEANWMLAGAYQRVGNAEQALSAAGRALALHPKDAVAYREISTIFATQGRIEEAATALMEGAQITSDVSLKSDLLNLYLNAPGKGCAIATGPDGPSLNLNCDAVHKPFCAASVEAVKAALEDNRLDVARQEKHTFLTVYGCPAGPLDQVLSD
jgi:tetratricopeptide (TPR) repeat protein